MTPTRAFETEAPLAALALAPAGAEMAAALKNGKIQIWSVAGKPLRSWTLGDRPIGGLFYAGDRRIVVVSSGSALLYDATSGQKLGGWEAHKQDIEWVAASRDGSLIATASDDGTVKLWDAGSGLVRTLGGGPGEMQGVAVSPAGDRVAGAGSDTNIYLFDARTGAIEHAIDLDMSCAPLAYSPDGRTLAAGSMDGSVTLWNTESAAAMGTLGRYPVPVGALRFSADGRRLASTGISMNPPTAETEARIWDLASRKVNTTPIGVSTRNTVGFAPNGRPLVIGIADQTISVWESIG